MNDGPVTDACAFHEWASTGALVPYLGGRWGEFVSSVGGRAKGAQMNVKAQWRYEHPRGAKAASAKPEQGPAGSDPDLLIEQLLGDGRRDRVVLGFHDGLLATAYGLPYVAREVVRAANDWTVGEWLDRDERLHAHVLVLSMLPDEAAAEIRRVGVHERMVAVALGANGLARGFGHPAYHPIYRAAAELDLPIVLQVGSDSSTDSIALPAAAGLPSTFAEYDVHGAQALMAHVSSMVMGGVFDLFPSLKVLCVGGGAAWFPWYAWSMDWGFKFMRRVEAPWLTELPSEYLLRHVRLSTYSLEAPKQPERLAQLLSTIPDAASMLLYASGYPAWDFEEPETVAARLPEEWHARVFSQNADEFYRWPGKPTAAQPVRPESEVIAPFAADRV